MFNMYYVSTERDLDELRQTLLDIGFVNNIDGDTTHYYWRADTYKKFYLSLENIGDGYVEFFVNIINGEDVVRFKIQPLALNERGSSNNRTAQSSLKITTIPLYGGGIIFGIRNGEEYIEGYDGDTIDFGVWNPRGNPIINSVPCPPAEWFALIAPENRNTDEWIYVQIDGLKYDTESQEYISTNEIWGAQFGMLQGYIDSEHGTQTLYGLRKEEKGLGCVTMSQCWKRVTDSNTNTDTIHVFKNLYTVNQSSGHLHRIYTIKNKKYILVHDLLACRYI